MFAGDGYGGGVYISTNGGANWFIGGLASTPVLCLAISGNTIFAGTSFSGIYKTTNNGMSWTQTSMITVQINSIFVSGTNIFAGTGFNSVYRSTNNGVNWTQANSGLPSFGATVYAFTSTSSVIFVGLGNNGVYKTTNNGNTWTSAGLSDKSIYALCASGNNVFAGTGDMANNFSGIYMTNNNGSTWHQKNQGFSPLANVFSLLITNNYIFAGTETRSVLRRSYTEAIGIQNISSEIPEKFSLSQNYPNPFNPSTMIQYALRSNSQVTMDVYDVLGHRVAELVNGQEAAGYYEVEFNATNLSSGVYFYRIKAKAEDGSSFNQVRKLILMK
jgi:hypothetical protein